ncbi:MAG: hypothetical protein ACI9DM_000236 [Cyclobacteriaceae bacterium]|jgi:hypothetical protein
MKTANFEQHAIIFDQVEQEKGEEKKQWEKEYQEMRTNAHQEMREAVNEGIATFADLEDICLSNGVDVDKIEEFLLSGF